MNRIELQFGKAVTRLAGNEYGRKIYNEQVKDKIDFSTKTQIVFPDQIISIASSFIQGFFDEIIANIGFMGVGEQVIVIAPRINVEEKIIKNLR